MELDPCSGRREGILTTGPIILGAMPRRRGLLKADWSTRIADPLLDFRSESLMSYMLKPWLVAAAVSLAACAVARAQDADEATTRPTPTASTEVAELRAEVAELTRRVQRLEQRLRAPGGDARRRVAAAPEEGPTTNIKIFTLTHADAAAIAETVRPLFATGDARAVFGGRGGRIVTAAVTIAVDQRTNTLIARGPEEELATLEAILMRLDRETEPREREEGQRERAPSDG